MTKYNKNYLQISLQLHKYGYILHKTPITNLSYVMNADGFLIDLLKEHKINYFWTMGGLHIKTGKLGQKLGYW